MRTPMSMTTYDEEARKTWRDPMELAPGFVELAASEEIYARPRHPYTRALLSAVPTPKPGSKLQRILLGGDVPSPIRPPAGCSFHPRCAYAQDICRVEEPKLATGARDHAVACHVFPAEP